MIYADIGVLFKQELTDQPIQGTRRSLLVVESVMGQYSFFLFARPSFSEGAGRVMDLGNTLFEYNRSLTERDADYHAFLADWAAIGSDLENVIVQHRDQQAQATAKRPARIGRT